MEKQKIQIRRGTLADWTGTNPTLALGEMALTTDTRQIKIGDGTTAWNSLRYVTFDGGNLEQTLGTTMPPPPPPPPPPAGWSGAGTLANKWATNQNFLTANLVSPTSGVLWIDYDFTVSPNNLGGFDVYKNGTRYFGVNAGGNNTGTINSNTWSVSFIAGDTITIQRVYQANGSLILDADGVVTINSITAWVQ